MIHHWNVGVVSILMVWRNSIYVVYYDNYVHFICKYSHKKTLKIFPGLRGYPVLFSFNKSILCWLVVQHVHVVALLICVGIWVKIGFTIERNNTCSIHSFDNSRKEVICYTDFVESMPYINVN